ncbi:hypothetical protein E4U27_003673 [Claviceps purpurea]|nr:hypothetical protein E4U27_003673 [Claviceps purpurea]
MAFAGLSLLSMAAAVPHNTADIAARAPKNTAGIAARAPAPTWDPSNKTMKLRREEKPKTDNHVRHRFDRVSDYNAQTAMMSGRAPTVPFVKWMMFVDKALAMMGWVTKDSHV